MKINRLLAVSAELLLLLVALPARLDPGQIDPKTQVGAVLTVLFDQQEAWNRGDVEAFMKGYWKSSDVTFSGSSGVIRGWDPVLERYRKNYPDGKAMGHLDFSELEFHPLGQDAELVLGRWHLKRSADELGGVFTLVFQKLPEGWRIIHDHTSATPKN